MRRFLGFLFFVLAFVFCFGDIAEARTQRNRGPRFASLFITNGEDGDCARSLEVEVTPLTRRGQTPRRARPFVTKVDLAGGGTLELRFLRWNHFYGVRIMDAVSGEVLGAEAIPVFRTYPVKRFTLPGTPDPRIAQIAALQQQISDLQQQLVELTAQGADKANEIAALLDQIDRDNAQSALLMQQIALLQGTIADQAEQSAALTAQIASLVQLLNQGSTANGILNQQIAALQAQQSSLVASNAALTSQMTTLVNLLAQSGTANASFGEQLAALQAQQAALVASNAALSAQIAQQSQQIAALLAQLAAGTPIANPTVATNSAFVNPTYAVGMSGVRLGSYMVSVPVGQSVSLSSVILHLGSHTGLNLQNLTLKVGGTQFGSTVATVGSSAGDYTFTATTPFASAAGSFAIDAYADILGTSTVGTYSNLTSLTAWSGTNVTGGALPALGTVVGQNVAVVVGPTLSFSEWQSSLTQHAIMGTTANRVASYRVTNNNVEDVRITDMTWTDTITGGTAGVSSFSNFTLWDGASQIAVGPVSMSLSGSTGTITFGISGGIILPKNSMKEFVLKADCASYASGGADSGSSHRFYLTQNSTVAVGTISGLPVNKTGRTWENIVVVARTWFTVGSGTIGSSSNRVRTSIDDPCLLSFTVDAAGSATISSFDLVIDGSAVPSSISAFTVDLIDYNTNSSWGSSTQATATWSSTKNAWVASFSPNFTVSAGSYKWVKVRVNSSGFANGSGEDDLRVMLPNPTWSDGAATIVGVNQGGTGYTSVGYE